MSANHPTAADIAAYYTQEQILAARERLLLNSAHAEDEADKAQGSES